jgi:hypothetical protein
MTIRKGFTAALRVAVWVAFVLAGADAVGACKTRDTGPGESGGTDAAPSSSASAAAANSIQVPAAGPDEEVKPVYPVDGAPPDPIAERLCKLVHEGEPSRRAQCCHTKPGTLFTSECVRTLSYALKHQAVTLDAADIDKCEAALATVYAGCEWVGPMPPLLPDACTTIVHGKLASGAVCRSSLECEGNMRCRGVGPTTLGRCAPPGPAGASCGGTVDTLATYTREDLKLNTAHPECEDFCNRRVCAQVPPDGTPCVLPVQCGPKHACVAGKCASIPPGKLGESCKTVPCDEDLVCIAGKCSARRNNGESCENDFQCKAGCLKADGGKTGTCGMKCNPY